MTWVGLGYRQQLASWIASRPAEVGCLEITAEHFFDGPRSLLKELSDRWPVFVHGLGLSLGTPGPLDPDVLDPFCDVVETAGPEWISEHVAFTRSDEVDLGHLNPIRPDKRSLDIVAQNARQLASVCGKPLLLENVTSHIRLEGDWSETEFLNRLCEAADCRLLLDVTNLYINSRNHDFDPVRWLREIDPANIVQLHVVGYSCHDGRWHDYHAEPIQDDLRQLIDQVLNYADVRSILIERDGNFPDPSELVAELNLLREALEQAASPPRDATRHAVAT